MQGARGSAQSDSESRAADWTPVSARSQEAAQTALRGYPPAGWVINRAIVGFLNGGRGGDGGYCRWLAW
jgi:hypothetical protein